MRTILATRNIEIPIQDFNNPTHRWQFGDLGQLMTILLQAVIIVAGLGAFAYLILGGIQYLTSGGEKAQVEAARNRITYAVVGLVIIIGTYALTRIIETIFGISIVSGICWPGPFSGGCAAPVPPAPECGGPLQPPCAI